MGQRRYLPRILRPSISTIRITDATLAYGFLNDGIFCCEYHAPNSDFVRPAKALLGFTRRWTCDDCWEDGRARTRRRYIRHRI